jgi:hypothetical protein
MTLRPELILSRGDHARDHREVASGSYLRWQMKRKMEGKIKLDVEVRAEVKAENEISPLT